MKNRTFVSIASVLLFIGGVAEGAVCERMIVAPLQYGLVYLMLLATAMVVVGFLMLVLRFAQK